MEPDAGASQRACEIRSQQNRPPQSTPKPAELAGQETQGISGIAMRIPLCACACGCSWITDQYCYQQHGPMQPPQSLRMHAHIVCKHPVVSLTREDSHSRQTPPTCSGPHLCKRIEFLAKAGSRIDSRDTRCDVGPGGIRVPLVALLLRDSFRT